MAVGAGPIDGKKAGVTAPIVLSGKVDGQQSVGLFRRKAQQVGAVVPAAGGEVIGRLGSSVQSAGAAKSVMPAAARARHWCTSIVCCHSFKFNSRASSLSSGMAAVLSVLYQPLMASQGRASSTGVNT